MHSLLRSLGRCTIQLTTRNGRLSPRRLQSQWSGPNYSPKILVISLSVVGGALCASAYQSWKYDPSRIPYEPEPEKKP